VQVQNRQQQQQQRRRRRRRCGDNAEQLQQQLGGEERSDAMTTDASSHGNTPIYDRPRILVNDGVALPSEEESGITLQIELVSAAHAPPACELLSHSQQELVDIIRRVKVNELTMDDAEHMFTNWKQRNKQGLTKSFRERKVRFTNFLVDETLACVLLKFV
jgi:hypothetical protein